jgi:hypothetical protein
MGQILRRNYLLRRAAQGKIKERIDVTATRGRRRKQLLDDLKGMIRYWKLKEKAPYRTVWRSRFGRSYECRKTDYVVPTGIIKRHELHVAQSFLRS